MSYAGIVLATALVASMAACALGSNEADGDTLFSEPVPGAGPGAVGANDTSGAASTSSSSGSSGAGANVSDAGDGGSHQGARAAGDASTDAAADDSGAHELGAIAWTDSAVPYRCRRLERFAFVCPAASTSAYAPVYGDGIYSDDSSVCTAARLAPAVGAWSSRCVRANATTGRARATA